MNKYTTKVASYTNGSELDRNSMSIYSLIGVTMFAAVEISDENQDYNRDYIKFINETSTYSKVEKDALPNFDEQMREAGNQLENANQELMESMTSVFRSLVENQKSLEPELDEYISNHIENLHIRS